jgi:hypothetical protein
VIPNRGAGPAKNLPKPNAQPFDDPAMDAEPRRPMSKRAKQTLLGVAGVLALMVVAFFAYAKITSTPRDSRILAHLNGELGKRGIILEKISSTKEQRGESQVQVNFTADGRLATPLYTKVPTEPFLRATYKIDPDKLRAMARDLTGPMGPRIREAAGITGEVPALLELTLIKESAAKDTPVSIRGSVSAEKSAQGWNFFNISWDDLDGKFPGQPKTAFAPNPVAIDNQQENQALQGRVDECSKIEAKLAQAQEKIREEIRAFQEAQIRKYRELLAPGSLFVGTYSNTGNSSPTPISIEITQLKPATGQVSALLRNDGGWSDARGMQGEFSYSPDASHFGLSLATRRDQAIQDAGPVISSHSDWTWVFTQAEDGTLAMKDPYSRLSLKRVAPSDIAKIKAELREPLDQTLAALGQGAIFQGTVGGGNGATEQSVILSIRKVEDDGRVVEAELSDPGRRSLRRTLKGSVIANRYRGGENTLFLRLSPSDANNEVDWRSIYRLSGDEYLRFKVSDQAMAGTGYNRTIELRRLTEAEAGKWLEARTRDNQRFTSLIKTGTILDGVVRTGNGYASRVRLKLSSVDLESGMLAAAIESREVKGIVHKLQGTFNMGDRTIALFSTGGGTYQTRGTLKVPFFISDRSFELHFCLEAAELRGTIKDHSDWELILPVQSGAAPTVGTSGAETTGADGPSMPTSPGAYVLIAGTWMTLPTNDANITYGAADVVGGLFKSLLGAVVQPATGNEKSGEKLANLTYSGTDQVPEVAGKAVTVAYIGERTPPAEKVVADYPQILDEPEISMAPLKIMPDGKRSANLYRIVPGYAGFGRDSVRAEIEKEGSGVIILRPQSPLAPGRYAVSVSGNSYELQVK